MANVLVQESSLSAIAAAIRAQNGTANTYKPAQMAPAILALQGSGPVVVENADGSEKFAVFVENGSLVLLSCRTALDTTNVCLLDSVTGDKYSLTGEDGKIVLTIVSASTARMEPTIVDVVTGLAYTLTAESGKIVLQEV